MELRFEFTCTCNFLSTTGERETQEQYSAIYLEENTDDSLCKPQHEMEQNHDTRPVVKHEPKDELTVQETTGDTATAAAHDDPIWSLPACRMIEKSSVPLQQDSRTFPSHNEQFSHGNTESSFNSSSTETGEIADDSLCVAIKVEAEIQPLCVESTTSESVHNEHLRHVLCPSVNQEQRLQPALQQAGPSLALPHEQRSTAETQDHILSRSSTRAKWLMNVWRANQKLFICSVCNKGFLRLSQLEEHKSTHQPFKPFRCLECGKSFTQKTRLKTHQSVHTGERPFSCKICRKMFSRQDNCLRHERFHSGLKPYSCGQCGKSFTVLGNLKMHQEIHLQGR